jgi:hypothetical protein
MPYDTEEERRIISELYHSARLYYNFFRVMMKLKEKQTIGSKTTKHYDVPKTPYRRVLESPEVSGEVKKKLQAEYDKLDIVAIKKTMDRLIDKLYRCQPNKRKTLTLQVDSYARQ